MPCHEYSDGMSSPSERMAIRPPSLWIRFVHRNPIATSRQLVCNRQPGDARTKHSNRLLYGDSFITGIQ